MSGNAGRIRLGPGRRPGRAQLGVSVPQWTSCWRHLAASERDGNLSSDVLAMHGGLQVSMQWRYLVQNLLPEAVRNMGLMERHEPTAHRSSACVHGMTSSPQGWSLCPHPPEPSALGNMGQLAPCQVSERAGLDLLPCAHGHHEDGPGLFQQLTTPCGDRRRPMAQPGAGVSMRQSLFNLPSCILFLLGLRLDKLCAFPQLLRERLSGDLSQRMAPFILDDDQQSTQDAQNSPANPHHAAEDAVEVTKAGEAALVDRVDDISVALEWKLLLPLLAPGAEDPQPDDRRPVATARCRDSQRAWLEQGHECIAQTIRDTGEQAVTLHSLVNQGVEEKDFWGSGWVVKKANSAEPLSEEKSLEGYLWVPVEVCSPKMRLRDAETRERMLRVLGGLTARHRLVANCTCEVHIHLGRMDGRPWSLSTLKRLGTLLWVAEPTLRSIRDPRSPNFDNTYTWGFALQERSRLAKRMGDLTTAPSDVEAISDQQVVEALRRHATDSSADVTSAFLEVWKTSSHLQLGRLLSGPERRYRRLGFNFSAFGEEDERARRNPRTMEFRMMDGSVDTRLILGWLAICGIIAEAAVVRSDGRFSAALDVLLHRSDEKQPSMSETPAMRRAGEFRELMQALGVQEEHYRGFEDKIRREHV
ncbi:hypothetical protein N657DRAFT_644229 [Parathielavia appendiculata]|uniref:Amidoligase enzyme n=1 Tax=Parathielavia appendiculata TaxID=2587402 RepID=A0AAN6Z4I9_9PEZI|nr:hypothetical protein N657DRAFT_644229 [Parathielavia appendiculata]